MGGAGAKLFPELQQLPCYTWASSPFVQLILKGVVLCLLVKSSLGKKKKKFNSKKLQSKSLFWEAFDDQRSDTSDKVPFDFGGTCLIHLVVLMVVHNASHQLHKGLWTPVSKFCHIVLILLKIFRFSQLSLSEDHPQ